MSELVVLVDADDEPLGEMDKTAAHSGSGTLHRAISVFVFGGDGRLLLQRRSMEKHSFRGLWANTACSHPRPGEPVVAAGERRLREEMGLTANLRPLGSFVYRALDPDSGLVEHEFDHVLAGTTVDDPRMDLREADAWDRVEPAALAAKLHNSEDGFVPWLRLAFEAVPDLTGPI